jgi:predicted transcriptional regulator
MECEILELRLSSELKRQLFELAKRNDLDMSKQVRALIRQAYASRVRNGDRQTFINSRNSTRSL